MSEHTDQINDHAIHARLEDVVNRVRDLDVPEGSDPVKRDRLLAVLAHAERYLAAGSRDVLSSTLLDQIQAPIDAIAGQLDNNDAAASVSYYDDVTGAQADALLAQVSHIPAPAQDELTEAAEAQVTALRALAEASLDDWKTQHAVVTEAIEETKSELEAARTEVGTHAANFEAKLTTMTAAVEQQQAQLTAALADFETKSAAQLTDLEANFVAAEEARAEQAKAEAESNQEAAEEAKVAWAAKAEDIIGELNGFRAKAAEVVGAVATTGTAGHFIKVANEEKKVADLWRWIALAFATAAVVAAFLAANAASKDADLDWQHLGAKALLSVSLAGLAGYAGKQSGGHRAQQRTARHTGLQLSSVEAFLVPVDTAERGEIRSTLARHVYGPPPASPGKRDEPVGLDAPGLVPLVAGAVGAAVAKKE